MGLLLELGVLAGLAHGVVLLDLLEEVVLVNADGLGQLLEGVALPGGDGGLVAQDVLAGSGLALDEVDDLLGVELLLNSAAHRVPEHAAAVLQAVGRVSAEVGVEDGVGNSAGLVEHLQRLGLDPVCLVEEALAVLVHEHERAVEHGVSLRMQSRGERAVLHDAAGPHAHLVAVARVDARGPVVAADEALHAALAIVVHHLGVAGDVARGQDGGLGGKNLLVAVGGAHDSALDAAALLALNELNGGSLEHVLGALVNGALVKKRGRHEVAGLRRHLEGAHLEDVCVGFLGDDGTARIASVDAVRCAVLVGLVEQPVHGGAGVLEPHGHEGLVSAVATGAVPAILGSNGLDLAAKLGVQARVAGTDHATAAVDLGGLVAHEDLGAVLNGRTCSGATGVAGAEDENLGLDGLDDVGIGDRLRLGRPAGSVERRRGRDGDVGRGGRVGQSGGGTSGERACGGGTGDKVAARNRAIHVHSFRCGGQLQRTESRRGGRAARRFSLVLECPGAAG